MRPTISCSASFDQKEESTKIHEMVVVDENSPKETRENGVEGTRMSRPTHERRL